MATSAEYDALVAKITDMEDAGDAIVALLQTLGPLVVAAAGDKAAGIELGNTITAKAQVWKDAALANTPTGAP